MVEELIPQVSAIFIVGLITSLVAYYIGLCKRVKEFMDKRKEEYAKNFSGYLGEEMKKSPLVKQPPPPNWLDATKEFWRKAQLQSIELQEKILFEVYKIKYSLEAMRNSLFASTICFVVTVILCYTVYSSYAIFTFVLALLLLLYGISLFIGISSIFLD